MRAAVWWLAGVACLFGRTAWGAPDTSIFTWFTPNPLDVTIQVPNTWTCGGQTVTSCANGCCSTGSNTNTPVANLFDGDLGTYWTPSYSGVSTYKVFMTFPSPVTVNAMYFAQGKYGIMTDAYFCISGQIIIGTGASGTCNAVKSVTAPTCTNGNNGFGTYKYYTFSSTTVSQNWCMQWAGNADMAFVDEIAVGACKAGLSPNGASGCTCGAGSYTLNGVCTPCPTGLTTLSGTATQCTLPLPGYFYGKKILFAANNAFSNPNYLVSLPVGSTLFINPDFVTPVLTVTSAVSSMTTTLSQSGALSVLFDGVTVATTNPALYPIILTNSYSLTAAALAPNNPLVWYKFDNDIGCLTDSSGNGYTLTSVGGATCSSSSAVRGGQAAFFGSSGAQFFVIPSSFDIYTAQTTTGLVITFWAKFTDLGGASFFSLSYTSPDCSQFLGGLVDNTGYSFQRNTDNINYKTLMSARGVYYSTVPIEDGNWHFHRIYWSSTGVIEIYVDGTTMYGHEYLPVGYPDTRPPRSSTFPNPSTFGSYSKQLTIGAGGNSCGSQTPFNGFIDDFRIYPMTFGDWLGQDLRYGSVSVRSPVGVYPCYDPWPPCSDTGSFLRCLTGSINGICCGPGTYFIDGTSTACQTCAAGTNSDGSGTVCLNCAAGSYPSKGVCTACPSGTYNSMSAASMCSSCAEGTYSSGLSLVSSLACTKCAAGAYSSIVGAVAAGSCTGCPAGAYSTGVGLTSADMCTLCAAGRYSTAVGLGSTSCSLCAAGKYSTGLGLQDSSTCALCDAGTFSTALGLASWPCPQCVAGTYATGLGMAAASCSLCAAGTYSTGVGIADPSLCALCDAGSYSSALGLATWPCAQCAAGAYSTGLGVVSSAVCTKCPAGAYGPTAGAAGCNLCGAGTYSSGLGLTTAPCPGQCGAGTYSTGSGLTSAALCGQCAAGTY